MVSVEAKGEDAYDGIPVSELRLDSVEWSSEQADHLQTRSKRYPGALDIEPEWATEAALDPRARIGQDPASKTGEGIRVTGWSVGAGRVLTVILLPAAHPPESGLARQRGRRRAATSVSTRRKRNEKGPG
jgi:hypothetical protein